MYVQLHEHINYPNESSLKTYSGQDLIIILLNPNSFTFLAETFFKVRLLLYERIIDKTVNEIR